MPGMRYQPQGRARIRPDWIARGLSFVQVGGQEVDFQSVNGAGEIAAPFGKAKTFLQSSSQYLIANDNRVRNAPVTIVSLARFAPEGSGDRALAALSNSSGANNRHVLYLTFGNRLAMFSGAASGAQALSTSSIERGVFQVFAGRVSAANSRDVWVNGNLVGSNSQSATVGLTDRVSVGAFLDNGSPTFFLRGDVGLTLVFSRALPDDDIRRLSANPWQVFVEDEDGDESAADQPAGYFLPIGCAVLAAAGGEVAMRISRRLRAAPAALAIAPGSIVLRAARRMSVQPAALDVLAGQVRMMVSRRLGVQPTELAVAGRGITMRAGRRLQVAPASLALAGGQVGMQYAPAPQPGSYTLPVSAAAMTLGGGEVGMRVSRRLVVAPARLDLAVGKINLVTTGDQQDEIDAFLVPARQTVVFEGSQRVVAFEGGKRVVSFEGSKRLVEFQ